MKFEEAFIFTLNNEGGYSDDPNDKGGETKFGISKKSHPDKDIKNLTKTEAEIIYRTEYWNVLYQYLPKELGIKLFDIGVNIGVKRAIRVLQNALNNYFDKELKIDGEFGKLTLSACLSVDKESLYSCYLFEISWYYNSLQSNYFKGWLNRLYKHP